MQDQENPQSTEQAVPDELVRAIENNPEEVAVLVERLGLVNDRIDVVELGVGAMDDEMVHSIARTGSTLAEVADAEDADAEPLGAVGLLRATRDPDVKAGLGYLVALAAALGSRTNEE
ncbi:hypothetical protein C440_08892 [Haloferax mucosum ATCC BAA-1512]|uniref:DUF1641 domain-containing protein n=1 Tax=Haloferax mucosum ATCC BAA-1512 TaxID=662479 RepID=M0IEJ3_9EURY|nr:DUF1641 domain-containing protein [Haloferax mucosum]ELZ95181.1 hypothetical protein C440_08892 [Haloferax mucosum ATCC BAA-1512]